MVWSDRGAGIAPVVQDEDFMVIAGLEPEIDTPAPRVTRALIAKAFEAVGARFGYVERYTP